jgi:hypothetical protein
VEVAVDNLKVLLQYFPEENKEDHKISFRIESLQAENQTQNLLNIKVAC